MGKRQIINKQDTVKKCQMMLEKNEAGKGDKEHWYGSRELFYGEWSGRAGWRR